MRTMSKTLPVAALLVATALCGQAVAERPESPLIKEPAIRKRLEMRRMRFEITPHFAISMNQAYKHAFGPGLTLQFHFLDWLGIGVEGSYLFNSRTALEDKVRKTLPNTDVADYDPPGPQPNLRIHDEHVLGINAKASVYAVITPFSGKFAMFSAAFLKYDMYAVVGLGLVNYVQSPKCCSRVDLDASGKQITTDSTGKPITDPNVQDASIFAGLKVGGMFGFGIHMYFNNFIGLQLEMRDYIVTSNPGGGDANADRNLTKKDATVQNNLFFGLGLTVLVPPSPKVTR